MTKLLGISGSLRRGSHNSALLRAATRLMPPEATLEVASIRGIPLYDYDVEVQGLPAAVTQLKEAIVGADGVLLVTPEYNNSIPGVFKNAIDLGFATLDILPPAITALEFHPESIRLDPAIHAAEEANHLALTEGIPFREAYRRVAAKLTR